MPAPAFPRWPELIAMCVPDDHVDVATAEQGKRALEDLRQRLGEEFPQQAAESGHSLCWMFLNVAPWTRQWLSWLAEALQAPFVDDRLVGRLRRALNYAEALSVLEVGHRLWRAGFTVEIDPTVPGSAKVPDLRIVESSTGCTLYVEVRRLDESRSEHEAGVTSQGISWPLIRAMPFVYYAGLIHKTLSRPHREEVVARVEAVVLAAQCTGRLEVLSIEGVLDLAISLDSQSPELARWAAEHGLAVGSLEGPPIDVNELIRTMRAIEKEEKQLPVDHPNLVVIENTRLLLRNQDMRRVIDVLEESVFSHATVAAAVITGTHGGFGSDTEVLRHRQTYRRYGGLDGVQAHHCVVLHNRFAAVALPVDSRERLERAFTGAVAGR